VGTKNKPGKFDCFSKAEPDEPMFVLLGRDPAAPIVINLWADIRARMGEDQEQIEEAHACADACIDWIFDLGEAKKVQYRAALAATEEIFTNGDDDRVRELETLVREMREQLQWCGGAHDFQANGSAFAGWAKGPAVAIAHSKELVP